MSDDIASLQAAHDRLKLLYQVSKVIHSTLDPEQALQLIIQEAVRLTLASVSRSRALRRDCSKSQVL